MGTSSNMPIKFKLIVILTLSCTSCFQSVPSQANLAKFLSKPDNNIANAILKQHASNNVEHAGFNFNKNLKSYMTATFPKFRSFKRKYDATLPTMLDRTGGSEGFLFEDPSVDTKIGYKNFVPNSQ